MNTKTEITKEEFLKRLDRSVEYAESQPNWMKGRPENKRETNEKTAKASAAKKVSTSEAS